jgi:hypothetical protein
MCVILQGDARGMCVPVSVPSVARGAATGAAAAAVAVEVDIGALEVELGSGWLCG